MVEEPVAVERARRGGGRRGARAPRRPLVEPVAEEPAGRGARGREPEPSPTSLSPRRRRRGAAAEVEARRRGSGRPRSLPPRAEPAAEAEAPAEAEEAAPAARGAAPAAEAPAQPSGPKPKGKRLPRAQRRQRPRPKRGTAAAGGARKPIVRLPKPEHERGRRNELQGTVVSAAMDKTIVVKVDTIKAHRRYQKVVRRSSKFHAHDEQNQAKPGDVVRIVETRPLSKTKNWRLAEIVEAVQK